MIHIFFVPGMFGSMIEMCLLSQTDLDGNHPVKFLPDGSSHSWLKQFHPATIEELYDVPNHVSVATPVYPWRECKLDYLLKLYKQQIPSFEQDKKILVHAPDQRWAEINLLFQYHKICVGHYNKGLDIFGGEVAYKNITQWNPSYTHWSQMAKWEYREWMSLFYPPWVSEWIRSPNQVGKDFLVVTNQSIINDTKKTLEKLFDFCGLSLLNDLESFSLQFRSKQQYILNEYSTIETIISSTVAAKEFSWADLSIIGEAILQNKFRELGYEWFCDGLDTLPTTSSKLKKIIYQKEIHA